MEKSSISRWMQGLNRAMPVILDASGAMLLSGSVMLINGAAGVAALGFSAIILNWRFYGDR